MNPEMQQLYDETLEQKGTGDDKPEDSKPADGTLEMRLPPRPIEVKVEPLKPIAPEWREKYLQIIESRLNDGNSYSIVDNESKNILNVSLTELEQNGENHLLRYQENNGQNFGLINVDQIVAVYDKNNHDILRSE